MIEECFEIECSDCDHGICHSRHVEGRFFCPGCEDTFTADDLAAAQRRFDTGEQKPHHQLQVREIPIEDLLGRTQVR